MVDHHQNSISMARAGDLLRHPDSPSIVRRPCSGGGHVREKHSHNVQKNGPPGGSDSAKLAESHLPRFGIRIAPGGYLNAYGLRFWKPRPHEGPRASYWIHRQVRLTTVNCCLLYTS